MLNQNKGIGTGTGTGTEPVKDSTPSFGSIISTLGTLGLAGTGTFELVKFVKHEVKDAVSPIEKNVEDVKMKVENIEASVNKVSYDKLLNNHSLI